MLKKKVMVAGTFRAGTNLMQYCLQEFFKVDVVFNEWFWKHGVPPTAIKRQIPTGVPVIVMTKEPVALNVSLYKFWKARRPELDIGPTFSDFIRRRFITYENRGQQRPPKYYYPNPTEYWNQFHFSWLNWGRIEDQRVFCRIEDLQADPAQALGPIAERFDFRCRGKGDIRLPKAKQGPEVANDIVEERVSVSDEDKAFITAQVDRDVVRQLGY